MLYLKRQERYWATKRHTTHKRKIESYKQSDNLCVPFCGCLLRPYGASSTIQDTVKRGARQATGLRNTPTNGVSTADPLSYRVRGPGPTHNPSPPNQPVLKLQ